MNCNISMSSLNTEPVWMAKSLNHERFWHLNCQKVDSSTGDFVQMVPPNKNFRKSQTQHNIQSNKIQSIIAMRSHSSLVQFHHIKYIYVKEITDIVSDLYLSTNHEIKIKTMQYATGLIAK